MPDVAAPSSKSNEKLLLIAAFIQGNNFPRRAKTKFVIEAKFDGEQLTTDPVDHNELVEINQELAWEIDRKGLQTHKLHRSCIKANCFAVNETNGAKENIGYLVLDVRSAPDGVQITKELPLLQSKYQKQKPTIQCMIYTESDHQSSNNGPTNVSSRPDSALSNPSIEEEIRENEASSSSSSSGSKSAVKIELDQDQGYFQIGKTGNSQQTYILTITLVFARNLVKLITHPPATDSSQFFFAFRFLNNQFTSKPFGDIISCQMSVEKFSARLHASFADLKAFFRHQSSLEIVFCSENKIIGRTRLDWSWLVSAIKDKASLSVDSPITVDHVLNLEASDNETQTGRVSPSSETSPILGVQCILEREKTTGDPNPSVSHAVSKSVGGGSGGGGGVIYQNDSTTITVETNPTSVAANTVLNVKSSTAPRQPPTVDENLLSYLTEDMQLKAAYELQVWKEQREKEFEANLKKLEAKRFQALADAFKQHDVEREIMIQKKIKEYNDLELLLKNSLSEVEKREKQLAFNEAQIARLKADLHHDYETKLIELREASKRVQEKADHQINLQKSKTDSLEEEISKYRRQILEWEKRYADKETEFVRYKEREHNRPEIKLQSEINMLKLEKMELERKLEAQTKAKIHYKEQFMKTLQELALFKKREEANARAMLKKQQMELDQLRMRYLAGEESDGFNRRDHDDIIQPEPKPAETRPDTIADPMIRQRVSRLIEERECLMRTGAYSNTDALIVELDRRIQESMREAKMVK